MKGLFVFVCQTALHVYFCNCNANNITGLSVHQVNTSIVNTTISVKNVSLVSVLNTTMKGVLVKGENVMLSDLSHLAGSSVDFLVILSSNSFVIDVDFERGAMNMTVVSPKWVVFGNRTINLAGRRGEFKPRDKGKHQYSPCFTGRTGEPGEPGETGGTFTGIGEKFFNGDNLIITTSGGEGGPGSGGSNGGQGIKGFSPLNKDRSFSCETASQCVKTRLINWQSTSVECEKTYDALFHCSGQIFDDTKTSKKMCKIEIYGKEGWSPGYDGGVGGAGGPGGYPGIMEFIDLCGESGVNVQNRPGNPGVDGKGGPGGQGGQTGDTLVYSTTEYKGKTVHYSVETKESLERTIPGNPGKLTSKSKPPCPKRVHWLGPDQTDRIVSEYMSFLSENFKNTDPFQNKYLTPFFSRVDSNTYEKRCSKYTISQLMDNLRELEEDYHKFNRPEKFLVLYETLLEKIRTHMNHPCSDVRSTEKSLTHEGGQKIWKALVKPQNMKVLRYMYTATLGRVYSLKDYANTVVITDIGEYLNSVHTLVQELQEVQGERNKFLMVLNKLNMVEKQKSDYGKYIANKFEEANNLITKEILPEIDRINKETMESIDSFLKEIEQMKQAKKKQLDRLREQEKKLKEAMVVHAVFGIFKIIAQALNFIPVVGPLLGAGTNLAVSAAESMYDFYNADDMILPEFSEVRDDVDKFKSVYNNFTERNINKDDKGHKDKKKKNRRKELAKTAKGLASGVVDVVSTYSADKSKLEVVQEQIKQGKEDLARIGEFENFVRDDFKNSLKTMGKSMKTAAEHLKDKSHASIDVTKWRIQRTLNNVMRRIRGITKGFKVQDKMVHCIEDMKSAMETLIELFDQIQDYQDQLNLANFIADVSIASATDTNITNTQFRNITHHLELIISSNMLLQKYQEAVNAFKQFVFPFAHFYFDGLTLPASITVGDSLEDLVNTALIQVNHLVKKLNDYKQTIKKHDRTIGIGIFNSKHKTTKPFFVWENRNHRDLISKLLSCKEVVLKADVKYSPKFEDAIKFNSIEFNKQR